MFITAGEPTFRSGPITDETGAATDVIAYALLAALFAFRLIYATFLGLLPDEAYYWDWSRNLSFGYFDHPPMVAWFIALSRALFGETVAGVRFAMCAAATVASAASYALLKKYVSGRFPLLIWVGLSNAVLLFGIGSMLATPDIPLVLFWSVSLWAGYAAIFEFSTAGWLFLGVCAGLGMLSKYTFVLFPVSLAGFLLRDKEHRRWLGRWQPWAAACIALAVWAPNLVWNYHHHWISMLFQANHGIGSRAVLHPELLGEFVAGQLGVVSILPAALLGFAAVWSFGKNPLRSRTFYLAVFFLVPFCFFLLSSIQKKVEANWTACSYVSGFMLVAVFLEHIDEKRKKLFRALALISIVFSAATTAVVLVHALHPFLPLASQNDPTAPAHGWPELAREIEKMRTRIDPYHHLAVCANRYQDAALLAFYLPDHPRTFALNVATRDNQYSLWPQRKPPPSTKVIFLHSVDDPYLTTVCERSFSSYALWAQVRVRQAGCAIENWGILTGTLR